MCASFHVPPKQKLTLQLFLLLIQGNCALSHCCARGGNAVILLVLSDLGQVEED